MNVWQGRQVGRRVGFGTVVAGVVVAVGLLAWKGVAACGPDFEPDVFVNKAAPDDRVAFAKGDLGLLEAGFDSTDYAVAYRYLSGGKLSAEELRAYAPPAEPRQDFSKMSTDQVVAAQQAQQEALRKASAPEQWLDARAQLVTADDAKVARASFPKDYQGIVEISDQFGFQYLNCTNSAFQMAVLTLQGRAKTWGGGSPWVANWIHGQDAVFSNCTQGMREPMGSPKAPAAPMMPDAAPAGSPALLQQDRAYQTAAAEFYEQKFDAAAQAFAAIARDKNSPWSAWGEYLQARALVRKAFAMGKASDAFSNELADYDKPTMLQAQAVLEKLLAEKEPQPSRHAVEMELNFVRIRTEPEKRLAEICAALAGPGPDANFANDLADLNFALLKGIQPAPQPPLLDWIHDWRGKDKADALDYWQRTHGLTWLALAMVQADAKDAATPELIAAAEKVAATSPAYDTVFFERVRLLEGLHRGEEARRLLDARLPEVVRKGPGSNENALLGQRMALARTFDEFLEYAPRLGMSGDYGWPAQRAKASEPCAADAPWMKTLGHCPTDQRPAQFDEDAVTVMNRDVPLRLWVEAAQSERLPSNLRQDVALAGWTRTVVLEDADDAAKLAPLLPSGLRGIAGVGFAADVAILRNPGLRPYLESGSTRLEQFGALDDFRDNWWDGQWKGRFASESPQLDQPDAKTILSAADVAAGQAEAQRAGETKDGVTLIGRRVIAYAKAHPEDAGVAEALGLTVRATRYEASEWNDKAGAEQWHAVSKEAFEMLHRNYAKSGWAVRTKYYY
jgi:hypothetical protein